MPAISQGPLCSRPLFDKSNLDILNFASVVPSLTLPSSFALHEYSNMGGGEGYKAVAYFVNWVSSNPTQPNPQN